MLGPQRPTGNLPEVVRAAGVRGPVALISAGWRYDEDRDEPLRAELGLPVHNLKIYDAYQEIEREAPDLARAHGRKQAALQRAKAQYRSALRPAMEGCFAILAEDPSPESPWFAAAVAHLRRLDELFLAETDRLHRQFREEAHPLRHPIVRFVRAQAADVLKGCEALLIAGGHVAILRNRLHFFGLEELLGRRPVFAWSAGAMVLGERVWLYHDRSARGRGSMELLDRGFGLVTGVELFPHAHERLMLEDRDVMKVLAARVAPNRVVGLENGAVLGPGGVPAGPAGLVYVGADGAVEEAS